MRQPEPRVRRWSRERIIKASASALTPLSLLGMSTLMSLLLFAWPATASAQDGIDDSDGAEIFERLDEQERSARRSPVPASSIEPVTVRVHWRLWKRVIEEGKDGKSELRAVREDLNSQGIINDPAMTMAAIQWLERRYEDRQIKLPAAHKAWESLTDFSPQLPHAPLARARFLLRHDPSQLKALFSSLKVGAQRSVTWYPSSLPLKLNLTIYALLAVALAGVLYLLAQVVRNFSTLAHDVARFLPRGFSTNQAVIALLALILLPGLLLQSPLVSALILLTLLGVVQQWQERLVSLLLLAIVAALPMIERELDRELSFVGSDAEALFQAQYMACDKPCQLKVDAIVEAAGDKATPLERYTQQLLRYRAGRVGQSATLLAESNIEAWPAPFKGLAYNLQGATLVAQAKPQEAVEPLTQALKLLPTHPAPAINKMRAHQMESERDLAAAALEQANKRGLLETVAFLKSKQRDVNSFLWVLPASLQSFERYHQAKLIADKQHEVLPVISRFWPFMAGKRVPLAWAQYLGLAGALLILITLPLSLRGDFSTPCPRCSLARDPEDGALSGDHHYCQACYKTFVTGSTMEYQARVQSEERINQRANLQRLTRRLLAFVAPGTGHASAGRALLGFGISLLVSMAIFWGLRPDGVWRGPQDLFGRDWYGLKFIFVALGGVAALVSWWGAWRGIEPGAVRTRKHKQDSQPKEAKR